MHCKYTPMCICDGASTFFIYIICGECSFVLIFIRMRLDVKQMVHSVESVVVEWSHQVL